MTERDTQVHTKIKSIADKKNNYLNIFRLHFPTHAPPFITSQSSTFTFNLFYLPNYQSSR
ncbi:hypothetical protein BpHYR1_048193 [Brachionus plicatilis]|uniref:Uncharacterized protein n=1 Tax=Brachionus plicatilis TaxID=10195 RepID=A0A3M7Q400_BRAPC|nr:hypothetical protein BpHYR1_048193 [Brachionus plicatilis]